MPLDTLNDLTPALRVMAKGQTHEVMLCCDGRDGGRADAVLERYAVVPSLAKQGLDPERVQPLLVLHLLRMIALYGAARRTGQAKDGDRRYLRILGAVID